MSDATRRILDAWTHEGPRPLYHRAAKDRLKKQWPTLYKALEALAQHQAAALAAAGLLASGPTLAEPHRRCDCVPTLGPAHCHGCGVEAGVEVPWNAAPCVPAAHERRVRAEAWDEGFTSGFYSAQGLPLDADASESTVANPYDQTETKGDDRG